REHQVEGGQDAQRAADIESAQMIAAGALAFCAQQCRDQEATEEEKYRHAELTRRMRPGQRVREEDQQEGNAANAVERGKMKLAPTLDQHRSSLPPRTYHAEEIFTAWADEIAQISLSSGGEPGSGRDRP